MKSKDYLTNAIAKWLDIGIEAAEKVQYNMSVYGGADFSEDSIDTLEEIARICFAMESELCAS